MQHDHVADKRTALYRVYADDEQLLYVGIGVNPMIRLDSHSEKAWWSKVARVEITWFPNRVEADEAERRAIETEHPAHNGVYAVRELPTPEPIVVAPNDSQFVYMTRVKAAQWLGLTEGALKQYAEWGWLIPYYKVSPGAARGRYLYSEEALEEFKRRWKAGEYDVVLPSSPSERSA